MMVHKVTFRTKEINIELDKMFKADTHTAEEIDSLVDCAVEIIFETGQASVSMLQRRMNLDYSTAVNIIAQLEDIGVVGSFNGSVPRKILITRAAYEAKKPIVSSIIEAAPTFSIDNQLEDGFDRCGGIEPDLLTIDLMEGIDFEYWCADLLRKLSFSEVEVTRGSGDQGVDILATKDGVKYAVQCKCYTSNLGNKPIQEVHAGKAMYGCHVGAVMTNRYFTTGGRQLAEATGVLLWDRDWISDALKATKTQ